MSAFRFDIMIAKSTIFIIMMIHICHSKKASCFMIITGFLAMLKSESATGVHQEQIVSEGK